MFKFGPNSLNKLNTCHPDLIAIHTMAIAVSSIDYGISEGERTIDRARDLFVSGESTLNPDEGEYSKHICRDEQGNLDKDGFSFASDIYIYHPDPVIRKTLQYHIPSLCYVAGVISSCAEILLDQRKITHKIRWGGNWDMDGVIIVDQNFDDLPHFEIIRI